MFEAIASDGFSFKSFAFSKSPRNALTSASILERCLIFLKNGVCNFLSAQPLNGLIFPISPTVPLRISAGKILNG